MLPYKKVRDLAVYEFPATGDSDRERFQAILKARALNPETVLEADWRPRIMVRAESIKKATFTQHPKLIHDY